MTTRKLRKSSARDFVDRRDCGICQCCYTFSDACIEIHHIHPLVFGGADEPNNMIALCSGCHLNAPNNPGEFLHYQRMGGWHWINWSAGWLFLLLELGQGSMTIEEHAERMVKLRLETFEASCQAHFEKYGFYPGQERPSKRSRKQN